MRALQQRFWDTALFATSHQAGSFFPNLRLPKMWREICQKIRSEVRSNLQKISGLCICYFDLLLFDKFFWRRKIQLADEKTEYFNLCAFENANFLSANLFLEGSQLKKICQMKAD